MDNVYADSDGISGAVFGLFMGLLMGSIIGLWVGGCAGESAAHRQAIAAGVAHWEADPKTGKTILVYGEGE